MGVSCGVVWCAGSMGPACQAGGWGALRAAGHLALLVLQELLARSALGSSDTAGEQQLSELI